MKRMPAGVPQWPRIDRTGGQTGRAGVLAGELDVPNKTGDPHATRPTQGISSMQAIWHGQIIAESDQTREVGGYTYFPRHAVRMDLLSAATRSPSDLACPHGVQFYHVGQGGAQSERAAWSYEAPRAAMVQVDHWIGFWNDVEIK